MKSDLDQEKESSFPVRIQSLACYANPYIAHDILYAPPRKGISPARSETVSRVGLASIHVGPPKSVKTPKTRDACIGRAASAILERLRQENTALGDPE